MDTLRHESRFRRLSAWLRRRMLSAPLFLPLVAVAGVILGGYGWYAVAFAFLFSVLLRLHRICVALLLCAVVAFLHVELLRRSEYAIREAAAQNDLLQLEGTVVKTLRNGVILGNGCCSARMVVRGENDMRVGEHVRVLAEPAEERNAALPGMFDAVVWRKGEGIAADFHLVSVEKRSNPMSLYTFRERGLQMREYLAEMLMPPGTEAEPARQVLCALVLGARDRAQEDTLDDFRRGGCLHAFAVSGLHVGLFSAILLGLLRLLRVSPVAARPAVIVGVGLYVLVTGASVPALRAYLLLVVLLGALILRRRCNLLNTWSFAALLVLMLAPNQLFNAGFLLSFAVYASLCMGLRLSMGDTPWFGPDAFIPARLLNRAERAYKNAEFWLRGVVVVSLSAWVAATPITMLCFHTFNTWSVFTNIAITPVLPVVMFCGMLHLALGWIPGLSLLTDWLAVRSAGVLLSVVGLFGDMPSAWLPATFPAAPQEVLIMGSDFGQSFTVLGNPGLVINPGNESGVAFRTHPAVFHAGFTPCAILRTRAAESYRLGANALQKQFPESVIFSADELDAQGMRYHCPAGCFSFYPAPADYPRRLVDSRAPVILWQAAPEWRVLYLGNAPAEAWYRMPENERRANVVILGRHPIRNIGVDSLQEIGAELIIQLPGTNNNMQPEHVAPAALLKMNDDDWVRILPGSVELNGSIWSAP